MTTQLSMTLAPHHGLLPNNDPFPGVGELPNGTPDSKTGVIQVSLREFYATIGPRNAIGSIINSYEHKGRGYVSELRDGHGVNAPLIGIRESGDFPFTPKRFFLVKTAR